MKEKRDAYVFISYASGNREYARELYGELTGKRHRITCWMDVFDIPVNDVLFQEHIVRGIQNASALVLVESEETIISGYVERELAEARANGIPIFHYRVKRTKKNPLPAGANAEPTGADAVKPINHLDLLNKMVRRMRVAWLDVRIKFRITQPFWLANLVMISLVLAMGFGIYFFGKTVTPLVVDAIERSLPDAMRTSIFSEIIPTQLDPKSAAPFHFIPDHTLLMDDFVTNGGLDESVYSYDIKPSFEPLKILRQDDSLYVGIPKECSLKEILWSCEFEIHSQNLKFPAIQYFGLRARSLQNNALREISVSVSTAGPNRRRTGFGWAFTDHTTPFYRPNFHLPEEAFYAYTPLDDQWHAYEILINPDTADIYYYLDGQFIGTVTMNYFKEWENAPLLLMLYTVGREVSTKEAELLADTHLEIDQIIVGGFK